MEAWGGRGSDGRNAGQKGLSRKVVHVNWRRRMELVSKKGHEFGGRRVDASA